MLPSSTATIQREQFCPHVGRQPEHTYRAAADYVDPAALSTGFKVSPIERYRLAHRQASHIQQTKQRVIARRSGRAEQSLDLSVRETMLSSPIRWYR
jgi:hypothetical protein